MLNNDDETKVTRLTFSAVPKCGRTAASEACEIANLSTLTDDDDPTLVTKLEFVVVEE
jgi:hypothetical protein